MCLYIQYSLLLRIFLFVCSWGYLDIFVSLTVSVVHKTAHAVEGHTFVLQGGVSEACTGLEVSDGDLWRHD